MRAGDRAVIPRQCRTLTRSAEWRCFSNLERTIVPIRQRLAEYIRAVITSGAVGCTLPRDSVLMANCSSNNVNGDVLSMANGTRYIVKPCAEVGAKNLRAGITDGLKHMSGRSRWLRFASAVVTLSDAQLDYLTDLDGTNRVAWCAAVVVGEHRSGIALARYARLPEESSVAEFAIAVIDEFQGQGVGSVLLDKLLETAAVNDIRSLRGYVLPQNEVMLQMCRHRHAVVRQQEDFLRVEILT